jgi:AraC-like DNA-binding protein
MNSIITTVPDSGAFHRVPHPLLSPFISQYTFRRIDIPANSYIEKAMPLRLVNSIDFFIGDAFDTIDCHFGERIPFLRSTVRGPRTAKKYLIRLRGQFVSFTVKFYATGMYQLLGIPMDHFRDKAVPGCDISVLPFENITSQLLDATDLNTCIAVVEPYLLHLASRRLSVPGITAQAVRQLLQQKGSTSIAQLAVDNNLSTRQLERNFIREVGVTPKIYARMLRFLHLLQNRMATPTQKWAALAYDADYFDQMHLVKEFKQFLGITPSAFVPTDFAF